MSRSTRIPGVLGEWTTPFGAAGPEVFVTPDGRRYISVPFRPKVGPNVRIVSGSWPPPSPATTRRVSSAGVTFSPATKPCPFGLTSLKRIDQGSRAASSNSKEWLWSLKHDSREPSEG